MYLKQRQIKHKTRVHVRGGGVYMMRPTLSDVHKSSWSSPDMSVSEQCLQQL